MFCEQCGHELEEGERYCTHCGAELSQTPAGEPALQPISQPVPAPHPKPASQPQSGASKPGSQRPFTPAPHADNRNAGTYRNMQSVSTKRPPNDCSNARLLLICLAIMVAAFAATSAFIMLRRGGTATEGDVVEQAQETTEENESTAAEESAAEEEVAPADNDEEPSDSDEAVPEVRASLGEYSWEELSQIAARMEECQRSADAYALAKDYHLIEADGTFPNKTKTLRMSDGKTVSVRLIGIWHDAADTPCERAGMTFITTNIAYTHRAGNAVELSGGWEASELRSYLQTTIYDSMPPELTAAIVPAYKLTNNAGKTDSLSSVTTTYDAIWAPSIVELCGQVDWEYSSNPARASFYNSVFNMEGSEYEAFVQDRISSEDPNPALALGKPWWMRSSAASTGRARYVERDGATYGYGDSNKELGVVFGFCL